MKIEKITWVDASRQGYTVSKNEVGELIQIVTVGILVKETEKTVALAQCAYPEEASYRDVCTIPKINIIERRQLRAGKILYDTR